MGADPGLAPGPGPRTPESPVPVDGPLPCGGSVPGSAARSPTAVRTPRRSVCRGRGPYRAARPGTVPGGRAESHPDGANHEAVAGEGEGISAKETEETLHRHPGTGDMAVVHLPGRARGEHVYAAGGRPGDATRLALAVMAEYLRHEGLIGQKTPEQPDIKDLLPRAVTPGKAPGTNLRTLPRHLTGRHGPARARHRTAPARAF